MNIKEQASFKRLALTKANSQIVGVAAAAAFITVLCLGAANYFWGIRSYQAKIIAADTVADQHLKSDVSAKNRLVQAYSQFVGQSPNVLGKANTTGKYTYNNATVILDALPSQYDFPALTSSIQALLQNNNFDVTSIGGTDQSATVSNAASSNPQPVAIPFSFSISNASYQSLQVLFQQMQESIRPLQIDNMTISGTDTNISLTVNAHTYFQPKKEFKIGTETIVG